MESVTSCSKTSPPKRTNVHIARQSLRSALLDQLDGHDAIKWGDQLVDFKEYGQQVELSFLVNGADANELKVNGKYVNGEIKTTKADLVVGADGIGVVAMVDCVCLR